MKSNPLLLFKDTVNNKMIWLANMLKKLNAYMIKFDEKGEGTQTKDAITSVKLNRFDESPMKGQMQK